MKKFASAVVAIALLLLNPVAAFAQAASGMDLSSPDRTIPASSILPQGSATLNVGGAQSTVTPTSMLTPAEAMALQQVLANGGTQNLLLSANGTAAGGTATLTVNPAQTFASLIVPQGVTLFTDFGGGANPLNLTGNLVNNGTLYAYSSQQQNTTATFSAQNILNGQGGLFSSQIPTAFLPHNFASAVSLNLVAVNNIVNAGTISSAANLSMIAGGSIINSLPQGAAANVATAVQPVMQAVGNLNLQSSMLTNLGNIMSSTGNINVIASQIQNAGLMQALNGSIAMRSAVDSSLNLQNVLGTIQAGQNILLETISSTSAINPKLDVSAIGGDLVAKDIIFKSVNGLVNIDVSSISGSGHISGGDARIVVQGGTLNIAELQLTGDPIFTNLAGDINFGPGPGAPGSLSLNLFGGGSTFSTSGGDFIVLAGGDINAVGLVGTIDASSASTAGGFISLSAGLGGTGGSIIAPGINFRTNGNDISLSSLAGGTNSGTISVGLLDTSGAGGICCTSAGLRAPSGQNAGTVTVLADGNVLTGAIRAFGGGGAGGYASGHQGGNGGAGGNVNLQSNLGSVYINGEVNTSGGGGGGLSATQIAGRTGGAGGASGNIVINAVGTLTVVGPLLAAGGGGGAGNSVPPCCPQIYRNGGGSFGGGGGGGDVGGGGGGYFGGGGSLSVGSGGGGGFFGGGGGDNGMAAGSLGRGGGGIEPFPGGVNNFGGAFGQGGAGTNLVAQNGFGNAGGVGGANGTITVNAYSMNTPASVSAYFGVLGTGFTTSPFASTNIFGTTNITLTGGNAPIPTGPSTTPPVVSPSVPTPAPAPAPTPSPAPRPNLPPTLPNGLPPQGPILPTDTTGNPDNWNLWGTILNWPLTNGTNNNQPNLWAEILGHGNGQSSGDAMLNFIMSLPPDQRGWLNPAYMPTGLSGDAMMNYLSAIGAFQNDAVMRALADLAARAAAAANAPSPTGLRTPTLGSTGTGFNPFGGGGPSTFTPFNPGSTGFTPFNTNSNGFSPFNTTSSGFTPFSGMPTETSPFANTTRPGWTPPPASTPNTSTTNTSTTNTGTGTTPSTTRGARPITINDGSILSGIKMPDIEIGDLLQTIGQIHEDQVQQFKQATELHDMIIDLASAIARSEGLETDFLNHLQKPTFGATFANPTGAPPGTLFGSMPGASSATIDVETAKLKVMIDKRTELMKMLMDVIDKYNSTADDLIRNNIHPKLPCLMSGPLDLQSPTYVSGRLPFNYTTDLDMSVSRALLSSPFPWERTNLTGVRLSRTNIAELAAHTTPSGTYFAALEVPARQALNGSAFSWQSCGRALASAVTSNAPASQPAAPISGTEQISLPDGNAFVSTDHPMVVRTTHGASINVSPNAKILVTSTPEVLGIYNLHDVHRDDVTATINGTEFPIGVGKALILSQTPTDDISPAIPPGIAIRRTEKVHNKGATNSATTNVTIFHTDFSIPSALHSVGPLRRILSSSKDSDKALANQLLKTAATLTVLNGAREPYKPANK